MTKSSLPYVYSHSRNAYTEKSHRDISDVHTTDAALQDDSKSIRKPFFVIDPHTRWKIRWNYWIGFFVVYSAITIPYRISFTADPWHWEGYLDHAIDMLFAIDIVTHFCTGFYDGDVLIHQPSKIRERYIRSWFVIDLIAIIPFDKFVVMLSDNDAILPLKLLRIVRLFRFLKLIRLFRLRRAFQSVQMDVMNMYALQTIQTLLGILFIIHLIACAWYMFYSWDPEGINWVTNINKNGIKNPYLVSFYWVSGTMMSVGYGDIVGSGDGERLFAALIMLLGSVCVGLIIANIQMLTENYDPRKLRIKQKLQETKAFLIKKKVPCSLRQRILFQYEYHWKRRPDMNVDNLLYLFPVSTRHKLLLASMESFLKTFPVFIDTSVDFFIAVIPNLRPIVLSTDQTLVEVDYIWEEVYFVTSGTLDALKNNCVIYPVSSGDVCAIDCLITERKRYIYSYRATNKTEVMALSTIVLINALKSCPTAYQYFHELSSVFHARNAENESKQEKRNSIILSRRMSLGQVQTVSLPRRLDALDEDKVLYKKRTFSNIHLHGEGVRLHPLLIRPSSKCRISWDILLSLIVIFTALSIPIRVAFDVPDTLMLFIIDRVSDSLFMLDIVMSFFTSYVDDAGLEVVHLRYIRRQYLKSSFILDVLSTIPFDWLIELMTSDHNFGSLRLLRTIKFVRLLRLVRVFKLFRLKALSNYESFISADLMQLLKLAIPVLTIAHYVGCFWYYIAARQVEGTSWTSRLYFSDTNSKSSKYVAAIYWAVSTMATVGYGDIYGITPGEQAFSIFVMIGGTTVFAYVLGTVIKIVSNSKLLINREHAQVQGIMSYVKDCGVTKTFSGACYSHLDHYIKEKTFYEEKELLDALSYSLRSELILFLNTNVLSSVRFFDKKPKWFLTIFLPKLIPQLFCNGDLIIYNENAVHGIYFIKSGAAIARLPSLDIAPMGSSSMHENIDKHAKNTGRSFSPADIFKRPPIIAHLSEGECFGYKEVLLRIPAKYDVVASKLSSLYLLPRDFFVQLARDFPAISEEIKPSIINTVLKQQGVHQRSKYDEIVGMNGDERDLYMGVSLNQDQSERHLLPGLER